MSYSLSMHWNLFIAALEPHELSRLKDSIAAYESKHEFVRETEEMRLRQEKAILDNLTFTGEELVLMSENRKIEATKLLRERIQKEFGFIPPLPKSLELVKNQIEKMGRNSNSPFMGKK